MSETTTAPAKVSYPERVAERAADIQAVRLVLSLLALPFFVLGLVLGVLWLLLKWCYAAGLVGLDQVNASGDDAG